MDAEIPGVKQVNRQFTAVRPGLPLSRRAVSIAAKALQNITLS
jgi:hypothetical protein